MPRQRRAAKTELADDDQGSGSRPRPPKQRAFSRANAKAKRRKGKPEPEGPEAASHSPPDVDQSPFFQDPPPGQMRLVVNRGTDALLLFNGNAILENDGHSTFALRAAEAVSPPHELPAESTEPAGDAVEAPGVSRRGRSPHSPDPAEGDGSKRQRGRGSVRCRKRNRGDTGNSSSSSNSSSDSDSGSTSDSGPGSSERQSEPQALTAGAETETAKTAEDTADAEEHASDRGDPSQSASPQPAFADIESDSDTFNPIAPAPAPMDDEDDAQTRSAAEVWGHHRRNVQRVFRYLGGFPAIQNLASNLRNTTLVSLYSGLGGAEVAAMTNHLALMLEGPLLGLNVEGLVNLDSVCRSVISLDVVFFEVGDPPEFVVPDLKSFVKPNVLKQAEERHSQLQASSAADLGLQQREEIGLDFVEEIVQLRLIENIAAASEQVLMIVAGSICKDFSSMGDGKRLVGKHAILFAIMVAIVRRVKPKCFMHECTSLFPGVHYFRRLLPEYTVVHFVVDPREHGSPTRRKRVYDLCLRADMDLPGGSSDFYRLYASTTTDASVFIGAGDEEVHLQTAKSLPEIRDMISKQKEVFINLDQSPTFMHHFGQELPVILASLNNMWAILQDRPLTAGAARNILAKTADAALSNWFVNLADEDPEEYKKVLVSSAPEPGAKRSKFSLAQYKEETVQKKIRAEREGMVLMDFTRYCQFHQHEVFPTSERMTASEVKTAWLRDCQGPDFEAREVFSKKQNKKVWRDHVWQATGVSERFKQKQQEESRGVASMADSAGSEHGIAMARKRLQSQNFLNMDDGDDTEFFRSWVAGFSKDESAIVAAGSAGTAEQVANARNKKRGGKKEKLVDVSFLRTSGLTKMVSQVKFVKTSLSDAMGKIEEFEEKYKDIVDLHASLVEKGVQEDRVLADAALGLDDKAGVVKCWYVFSRRRRACQILLNEDLTVTPDPRKDHFDECTTKEDVEKRSKALKKAQDQFEQRRRELESTVISADDAAIIRQFKYLLSLRPMRILAGKSSEADRASMSQALLMRKGRNTLQLVCGEHKDNIDAAVSQYRENLEQLKGADRNQCPGRFIRGMCHVMSTTIVCEGSKVMLCVECFLSVIGSDLMVRGRYTNTDAASFVRESMQSLLPEAWLDGSQTHNDILHAWQEQQAAIDAAAAADSDTKLMQKGSEDYHGVFVSGARDSSVHVGLECHGLANVRVIVAWRQKFVWGLVSGGLLVIAADAQEVCDYFRTSCLSVAREKFGAMEIADVPDGITVPSMTVGYARTGDILYLPQGSMTATKAINGDTLAVRIVSTAFHEKGLHTLRNLIAKQVKAKPMLVYALGVLPQITSPAAQDDEAAADDDDEAIFAELTEHMTEEEKREAAGGMGAPASAAPVTDQQQKPDDATPAAEVFPAPVTDQPQKPADAADATLVNTVNENPEKVEAGEPPSDPAGARQVEEKPVKDTADAGDAGAGGASSPVNQANEAEKAEGTVATETPAPMKDSANADGARANSSVPVRLTYVCLCQNPPVFVAAEDPAKAAEPLKETTGPATASSRVDPAGLTKEDPPQAAAAEPLMATSAGPASSRVSKFPHRCTKPSKCPTWDPPPAAKPLQETTGPGTASSRVNQAGETEEVPNGADGPNVHFHEVYADTGMCWQAAAGDAIDGKDKIIKPTKTKTKKEKKDKTDDAPKSSASKASKNKVDDDKAQPKLMAFMQQQQQHERATHVPSNVQEESWETDAKKRRFL
ncbi:unnamed protein product [Symbiodinium microadriaticum]|nr:unnamed protein product [Symbiodinium microadriaticum]